ncbi:MAG: BACON domain-containing protein [Verrucomicrobia bacterium]|nr:BACON domain-containing protein [Verrucomicrobiota bacterium]
MKPTLSAFVFLVALLASPTLLRALEIDPQTREHSANDPSDWSAAITVRSGPNDRNWTAAIVPDQPGDDATWLSITPVPPNFLVYAMNENFNAEPRTAYIEFTGGVRFKAVQSGRGSTLSTNAFAFGQEGGTNQLTVTVLPGTLWAATSTASWIRILTGPRGFGNDTVKFAVAPHDGVLPREGTFVVGGNVVRISQNGIDLTIEPQQAVVVDQLTIVSFNVTALASQSWKPVSLTNWIAVVNPGPGNGNGTVTLSILPNKNYQPRQGSVAVGSKAFLVNQAGNQNPTLTIVPTSTVGGDEGAQGRINVTGTPGLPWPATSDVPWLQIVSGAEGIGNDTIAFVISPNRTLAPRDAVITVSAADPLSAPDLRRGLSEHLVFDGASAGDNLIVAQVGIAGLKDFSRTTGRNGGQALRFDTGKSWTFDSPEQQTLSFWVLSDFSNRQAAVANIGGHTFSWYHPVGTRATGQ